jgi:hypothetical protein
MSWTVVFDDHFDAEFGLLAEDLQDELLAHAILLVGANKVGADQRRFYKRLIEIADNRYDSHLATLKRKESSSGKKTR